MEDTQRRVDAIREDRSELENHIIDEYAAGKITRREFVRRGTVVGSLCGTIHVSGTFRPSRIIAQ